MKVAIITLIINASVVLSFAQNACNTTTHSGEGTYYDFELAGGFGNCSFDDTKIKPFLIGAMNDTDYGNADYCGACVEITGPKGKVKVQIIDRCPECKPGDIDLSPEAFEKIANIIDGRIAISWYVVPCPTVGDIAFHFKEGSNQWWSAVQVRNTKNHITKLEFRKNGTYISVPRLRYNYFVYETGFGPGPYDFRITDVYGNVLEEKGIPFQENTEKQGSQQFSDCNVVGFYEEEGNKAFSYIDNGTLRFSEEIKGNYAIYNSAGQQVKQHSFENEIEVKTLSNGIYFLKIVTEKGTETKFKFVL